MITFLPKFLSIHQSSMTKSVDSSWLNTIKKLERKESAKSTGMGSDENFAYQYDTSVRISAVTKPELFYFDPNTISSDEWKKLGLTEKNIQTILNYIKKGGHFYKAEDLQKIYGLSRKNYERLEHYIRIKKSIETESKTDSGKIFNYQTSHVDKRNFPKYSIIDINLADTSAFIALPGIGSKLASRIVNFRDKLGGFYSIEQVSETFGLPDSTFQKIKQYLELKNPELRQININTATIDELKAHPYIRWSMANPVIAFRNEHGPFSAIEDIKKIPSMTDAIYKKVSPYLKVQ